MRSTILWANLELPNENKWRLITQYRDELLERCNWTQLPDALLTFDQRTAWIDYRQTLREIEENFTNPDDVVFPEAPSV